MNSECTEFQIYRIQFLFTLPEAVDMAESRPLWTLLSMPGAIRNLRVACQKRTNVYLYMYNANYFTAQCLGAT